jgi:autotransporter-associated beta strand protein
MKFCSTISSHVSRRWPSGVFVITIQIMAVAMLLISQSAFATDTSWTGASSTVWATSSNWSPSGVPTSTDNALFSAAFTNQPSLTASAIVGGLWIKTGVTKSATISAGSTSYVLTLNGNTINGVAGRGILVDNTSSYSLTVGCSTNLGNTQYWDNNSTHLLTVNGAVNLNAKILTVRGNGNTLINGVLSSTGGSLQKVGGGTLTLTGANTYTGATAVLGGTLLINGSQSLATGAVSVSNSGSTLGGIGTIGGAVTVNSGASLAPGNGGNTTGFLSVPSVTLASGANFKVDLNGWYAGSGYDQLIVRTGGATITGSNLVVTVGAGLYAGQTFTILNKQSSGAVTGTFVQGSSITTGGYTFSINYAGGDGNDIVLTVTSTPIITTAAGSGPQFLGNGGPATSAGLGSLMGLTFRSGNLYICDSDHNIVVKVASAIATVVAGNGTVGFSGDGGPATSAALHTPIGTVFDSSGNMYIAEFDNGRIRKVTPTGVISTFAGCPTCAGTVVEGSFRTSTAISHQGIAIDASNNVYFSDGAHDRVRTILASNGNVYTVAGNGTYGTSGDGGLAVNASLSGPSGISFDSSNNLYIPDGNRLRKVTASTGIINTIATFGGPLFDSVVDGAGNVYVTNGGGNAAYKVAPGGSVTTIIGSGVYGFSGDGGPATNAAFKSLDGIARDGSGNIYVADQFNYRVRKDTVSTGIISTFAGSGTGNFWGDGGSATSAGINRPQGMAFDASGNMYIADTFNNRVRKVTTGGTISTFAGTGLPGFSGNGGAATSAMLNEPTSVAVDSNGNVFVMDSVNSVVRKITPGGIISTYAGGGISLGDGGPATSAQLGVGGTGLGSIALDKYNNLYIADPGNARVRKVTASTGIINTVAGNGVNAYSGDGGPATSASLQDVFQISIGPDGSLYITSQGIGLPPKVRKVTNRIINRWAGGAGGGVSPGSTTKALDYLLENPPAPAFYGSGSAFLATGGNNNVMVVPPNQILAYLVNAGPNGDGTGFGGPSPSGYSGDGGPALKAMIYSVYGGLATDSLGNLYIVDQNNFRIRKVWLH